MFIVPQSFFRRPVLDVAPELLGKYLVRRKEACVIAAMITEVEAYDGPTDLACHASKGRTKRTEVLFGPPGHFYVYLCYGVHWMLNIVTGEPGYPAAVLIRGIGEIGGPGRVTKHLAIDGAFHGVKATRASHLWVEDRGTVIDQTRIRRTPRIGVEYAGVWAKKPYRFLIP